MLAITLKTGQDAFGEYGGYFLRLRGALDVDALFSFYASSWFSPPSRNILGPAECLVLVCRLVQL